VNFGQDLGVQSYCFRHFKDNKEVAQLVRQCGLERIELCAVHVDFGKPETFESVIADYHAAGVAIGSIGVQSFKDDPRAERNSFEFARAAGARDISVTFGIDSAPQCYRTAEKLADEYDMSLGIHNHGGYDWLGNIPSLQHVFANSSKRIGLCLDTAWALDAGHNAVDMAQRFADRLYGVHIKDFIFDRARRPEDVVVGSGNLDLPRLMQLINANPATHYAVLEYEGDVENPVPALQQCVAAVRASTA
jgi:sugar phosphate isomerase/epimerase